MRIFTWNLILLKFLLLVSHLLLLRFAALSFLLKKSLYFMMVHCSKYEELLFSLNLESPLDVVIGNIGKGFRSIFLRHDVLLDHFISNSVLNIL